VAQRPDAERELLDRSRRVRDLLRGRAERLHRLDPRETPGLPGGSEGEQAWGGTGGPKRWSRAQVERLGALLGARQERLYARAKAGVDHRRVLLVLQALDCGGKDGTIRSVVGAVNPLGVQQRAFGPPTAKEHAQHFLWRISRVLPPAGYIGVFNRSHYEDVLVVRVRELASEKVWRRRYDEINAFEEALVRDGLTLVKVMLHISYAEQGKRLRARLDDPSKRWKFNPGDLDDRAHWTDYQHAYADVLDRCSSAAPWYVVPADRKWYRNWAVANLLLAHLEDLDLRYPEVEFPLDELRAKIDTPLAGQANPRKNSLSGHLQRRPTP
jgi:PPK2 family polyphosphate:nucleotide phosphotransferase